MVNKKNKFCLFCFFATFFGVGKMKWCPGTWGSIATIPFWFVINFLIYDTTTFLLFWSTAIAIIFALGVKSSDIYLSKKGNGKTDPGEIVIDEVAGQLIALFIAMAYYINIISTSPAKIAAIISSTLIIPFIMFRIFDIWKPWIIGSIDKNMKGGLGIMMDDVVAGIFGGLATIPFILLFQVLKVL